MKEKFEEIKIKSLDIYKQTDDYYQVISGIFKEGATYEMTIKALIYVGLEIELVGYLVGKSNEWKDYNVSFEDSFFNFLEIDEDLI